MPAGVLETLCHLAVQGRLSDAISLIREAIGAEELVLVQFGSWVDVAPSGSGPTSWFVPLYRSGHPVGELRGRGPGQGARLERYADVLALALPDRLTPLARVALEGGNDGFWTLELGSSSFTCTERFKELLRAEGASLLGPGEALDPEDRLKLRADLDQALADRRDVAEGVYRTRPGDPGVPRALRFRTRLLRDEGGGVTRLVGVVSDVTAEVEARTGLEGALARARRYQTLFSLSETLSAIIDLEGQVLDASPTWRTTLGWDSQELSRRNLFSLLHEEDRKAAARLSTQALAAGKSFSTVNRFRTRDGQWRTLSWNAVPDPREGIIYAVAHDITNLTRTQERLERSEALLKRAGALAHVGGWEYEVATRTLVWNEETRRIHQVDADFSPSLDVWLLFYEARSRPLMAEALQRCLHQGEPFDLELGLISARGVEVWVRAQGQADRVHGTIDRLYGAFQDITQQREAREAVLQASRAKSQFLANTSHEIRTPLNGILGMTQLALDSASGPEQREYLEAVTASGQNLLAIVNDILDISKIEAGRLELESMPVVLGRLVHETVRSQAPRAHARGLELVTFADAALAQPMLGDPVRLGQILTNLVGNAIKFTEVGEVVVEARARRDGLHLTVRDTGVGIPPARQGAIFEAFTQGDGSTNRRFGGTGLGLTITRELVTRMGGRIEVRSEVGQGSCFEVHLPWLPVGDPPSPRLAPHPVRVLVVDDHPASRRAVCEALTHLGAQPTEASTAEAALAALRAALTAGQPHELLVTDLELGGTSGLELCEHLAQHAGLGTRHRVLLTTTTQRADPKALARLGIHRTLTKPVAPWELREVLEQVEGTTPAHLAAPEGQPALPPRAFRVLLAEDNAINARVAVRLLEKLGHTILHVGDGQLAVEAVSSSRFDVVLMDMQMPNLDGLEATRRIRALEAPDAPRLPIIALTANAMKGDDTLCLEAGMDAYLTKPIEVNRLREALERHVRPPSRHLRLG
jgi:PAS domain S-box-containing protein